MANISSINGNPIVVDASGLADGSLTTAKYANGSVTGQKMADGSVTADKLDSDLLESIDESKHATGHVSLDRQLEFGSMSITTAGWNYSAATNRVRLVRGTTLHLVPGDTVGFADITKEPRFYYGYESNGSYYVPDARWLAVGEVLNVENEGNYVFHLRATADGGLSGDELMEAVSSFYIDHITNLVGDAAAAVTSLESDVDELRAFTLAEISNTYASVSHQGYSYTAPKSTAAAYIESRRKGYLYAENDVNKTSDGQLVMWHDNDLSAAGYLYDVNGYLMYAGSGNYYGYDEPNQTVYKLNQDGTYTAETVDVQDLSRLSGGEVVLVSTPSAVLMHFDVGRYRGDDYAGERILTFREWILLCKKLGMHAYIDHKPNIIGDIPEMMGDLTDLGMVENVTWIFGGTTALAEAVRQYDSGARIAILSEPTDEVIAAYNQLTKGRGISFDLSNALCTTANAQKVLRAGYGLECYYIGLNSVGEETAYPRINELLGMGVQRITLDRYLIRDAVGM